MKLSWHSFALFALACGVLSQENDLSCSMPDDSAATSVIMNITRQNMMNCPCTPSGPCNYGCCPVIVKPSCKTPARVASVIEGYSGYRGNAAIIIDWGNCAAKNPGGFFWWVDWGDGSKSSNHSDTLGPYQETHTYHSCCRRFLVVTAYCAVAPAGHQACCDYYHKWIVPTA
eukprot:m.13494 g.13494  ORF g.13494 m.13494 type:complete len:172 (+) comp24910_c0_seq1:1500-2015(+)